MSVVFDTNVLLSSTLWHGSVAQKLLVRLIRQDIPIFVSTEILLEYETVLKREFHFGAGDVEAYVRAVHRFAHVVVPKRRARIVQEDPDDDKVIECAIESCSDIIFTYDKHLLKIGQYGPIPIMRPEDGLKRF